MDEQVLKLKKGMASSLTADSIAELMGIEGHTARVYFSVLRTCLIEGWNFDKRTRRPPKDPVNVLLSLGYTLLGNAIFSALHVVGLDPFLGFFHTEKHDRPALMLDLVEEFRSVVVDSLVLDLVNHNRLKPKGFLRDGAKLKLSERGLGIFLTKFTKLLERRIRARDLQRKISCRKLFEVQARKLRRCILDEEDEYQSYRAR